MLKWLHERTGLDFGLQGFFVPLGLKQSDQIESLAREHHKDKKWDNSWLAGDQKSHPSQFIFYIKSSLVTHQGQSVGPGQKSRRKFSSTGGRAPGYRLSPGHFETIKRMLAPDWAQKMLCIIVPNLRTASLEFFSCVRTRPLLSLQNGLRVYTKSLTRKSASCKNKFLFKMVVYWVWLLYYQSLIISIRRTTTIWNLF